MIDIGFCGECAAPIGDMKICEKQTECSNCGFKFKSILSFIWAKFSPDNLIKFLKALEVVQ